LLKGANQDQKGAASGERRRQSWREKYGFQSCGGNLGIFTKKAKSPGRFRPFGRGLQ